MVTATSRTLLLAVLAAALGGCGSSTSSAPSTAAGATALPAGSASNAGVAGFAWLHPQSAPADWVSSRLGNGATLAYPPSWHAIAGDHGTASAALLDPSDHYLGYLNLTPRQSNETLAGWAAFRVHHNREEGERDVASEGAAAGLRFRTGHGSCVRDAYTTSTNTRYVELACLVAGRRAASVIVGAAPQQQWDQQRSAIEQAISALIT